MAQAAGVGAVGSRRRTACARGCGGWQDRLLEGERLVDFVAGPDAYRDLPRLVRAGAGAGAGPPINVQLSTEETCVLACVRARVRA